MKKYLVLLGLVSATIMSAQTLTYEMVQQCENKRDLDANWIAYIASDNYTYEVGDTLTIGESSKNHQYMYITSVLNSFASTTPYLHGSYGGQTAIIREFKVFGFKKGVKKVNVKAYLSGIGLINIDFEQALATQEIKGKGMTPDQALEELKKAKDKLDLELITQEEYDALKAELRKYL